MATDIEDITHSVSNLDLVGELHRSICDPLASLPDVIHSFARVTETVTLQVLNITSAADDAVSSTTLPITEVCSLHERAKKLADTAKSLTTTIETLNEVTEGSVIAHLRSLGSQSTAGASHRQLLVGKLFSHFDKQIRSIVRDVLNTTSDESLLWKVAEKCYKEAARPSGALEANDYLVLLREARVGWPYDEDYEREEYYDHEDHLALEEGYEEAFQAKIERKLQAEKRYERTWVDFWVTVLNNSPAGPTLFYPSANRNTESLKFEHVPRYLFRTFDCGSSGTNNESVIASTASKAGTQGRSRIDLLAMKRSEAAELLRMHLKKSCFDADKNDNLMSWTSSLLFAIQYAVWRSQWRQPCDIKICVVGTGKFPQGQFARDAWLIEAYKSSADQANPAQDVFELRLGKEQYYNGEYLSQGAVSLARRSCVTSLELLKEFGLFELYPEFEDAEGSKKWTNRVLELRQIWSTEQSTTEREIELALKVARECFSKLIPFNVALILLTFQNRRLRRPTPINTSSHYEQQRPEWAEKPSEVRRYWIATEAAKSLDEPLHVQTSQSFRQDQEALRLRHIFSSRE